jgi:hypothetical protein
LQQLTRLASQQYFKSVADLVDDLREKPSTGQTKSIHQYGTWFSRYADKIDKLPILNVDPVLLDYGLYVSTSFRNASETIRSAGGRTQVRQLQNPNHYVAYGRWGTNGAYGGYVQDVKAVQSDRTRILTEERISSATDARGIMQDILAPTQEVCQQMSSQARLDRCRLHDVGRRSAARLARVIARHLVAVPRSRPHRGTALSGP